ncbi:MAG: MFS transporter [Candidatus Aminicenantes bacterium]|nr:MFS transporter [Candidatus Aminicenantes bacterium]
MIRDIQGQWRDRTGEHRTFLALRHRNYRLWFYGQLTSLFGSWMQSTALGFLVFELTKSPTFLGLVGFAAGAPTWLFMLMAGVVADRVPRRRVMIITQTGMMALALLSAALVFTGAIRPWHIILLALGFGTANSFDAPARQALVQELVPIEDMTNAIALNSAMFNTSAAIGPAVGGMIYAFVGPGWCFFINGLSFVAIIIALTKMKLPAFVPRPRPASLSAELKEGLRYAAGQPVVRTILGMVFVISMFGFAFVTLIPAWAVNILHGNATTNGLLTSARGLGAVAAALFIASLGRFRFRGKLLTFGSLSFPILMIVFAFIHRPIFAYLTLFAAGFALILVFNLSNASIQSLTPNHLRGRVMGIYAFTFFGSIALGSLLIGAVAGRIGEPPALVINSLIALLFGASVYVFMPKLRALE